MLNREKIDIALDDMVVLKDEINNLDDLFKVLLIKYKNAQDNVNFEWSGNYQESSKKLNKDIKILKELYSLYKYDNRIIFENINYNDLHWQSDWNGDEVGYPDRNVVGYYTKDNINLYIDMENDEILEVWMDNE
ncbi:hypothetical protein Alsa2_CDS0043 [Staphylococcus phage Alsa_2]|nr:hypothetical protein Alsa2_CDS0043 [Staphylococcus phage Alsa_2]